MTKNSCSFLVRGEIFVSARTVKILKSPSGREPIFIQGSIIYDLRLWILAGQVAGGKVSAANHGFMAYFVGPPIPAPSVSKGGRAPRRSCDSSQRPVVVRACPVARPFRRTFPADSRAQPTPWRVPRFPSSKFTIAG